MAEVRPRQASLFWLFVFVLCTYAPVAAASPTSAFAARSFTTNNSTGTLQVFDGSGALVAQAPATDGSGTNFDFPALIWIGFSLIIGLPMSFAGIRGWRITTGVGVGLTAAVCTWVAIINSISAPGIADIVLSSIVLVIFLCGFALGVFEVARLGGITALGVGGGVAFGVRIVLLKQGLLFGGTTFFAINWALIGFLGVCTGLTLIRFQRYSIVFGCASIGTFMLSLGVDLVLAKQSGLSAGLRYLFDRNTSHISNLFTNGYHPEMRTRVILIASLALTPVLAYAQHRFFPAPFTRRPVVSDAELGINFPTEPLSEKRKTFSLWSSEGQKQGSGNRFSVL